jgi:hypothetical protein
MVLVAPPAEAQALGPLIIGIGLAFLGLVSAAIALPLAIIFVRGLRAKPRASMLWIVPVWLVATVILWVSSIVVLFELKQHDHRQAAAAKAAAVQSMRNAWVLPACRGDAAAVKAGMIAFPPTPNDEPVLSNEQLDEAFACAVFVQRGDILQHLIDYEVAMLGGCQADRQARWALRSRLTLALGLETPDILRAVVGRHRELMFCLESDGYERWWLLALREPRAYKRRSGKGTSERLSVSSPDARKTLLNATLERGQFHVLSMFDGLSATHQRRLLDSFENGGLPIMATGSASADTLRQAMVSDSVVLFDAAAAAGAELHPDAASNAAARRNWNPANWRRYWPDDAMPPLVWRIAKVVSPHALKLDRIPADLPYRDRKSSDDAALDLAALERYRLNAEERAWRDATGAGLAHALRGEDAAFLRVLLDKEVSLGVADDTGGGPLANERSISADVLATLSALPTARLRGLACPERRDGTAGTALVTAAAAQGNWRLVGLLADKGLGSCRP